MVHLSLGEEFTSFLFIRLLSNRIENYSSIAYFFIYSLVIFTAEENIPLYVNIEKQNQGFPYVQLHMFY